MAPVIGAPPPPACGNCWHFRPPKPLPLHTDAAALGLDRAGTCFRFPQPVPRHEESLCGEHPALIRQRDREFAEMIAGAFNRKGR